jgi:hypothetical protein
MRFAALVLLAGCATAPPPTAEPAASDRARRALDELRAHRSVRTRFESTLAAAKSDALVMRGEAVSVAGGVAFVRYRFSGGDVKRIVRVNARAWVYHEVAEEWVAVEELGMSGAGNGVQNVDGLTAVLRCHADTAVLADKNVLSISFAGPELELVVKEHTGPGAFVWEASSAEVRLHLDGAGAIRRVRVAADLLTADHASARYEADVTIESVDAEWTLKFDVPIAPGVLEAVLREPGLPPELARALRE